MRLAAPPCSRDGSRRLASSFALRASLVIHGSGRKRRRFARAPRALALLVLAASPAIRGDGEASVRLAASAPRVGAVWHVSIASPYPERPFELLATSPGGEPFAISSGTTDARGRAALALELREDPTLAGVDLRVVARVAGTARSWALSRETRLVIQDAETPVRESFRPDADLVPLAAGLAEDGEIVDIDGDGDLDLVLIASALDDGAREFLRVLVQDASGGLHDETSSRIAIAEQLAGTRVHALDIERDGDVDLFVLAASPLESHALFLNDGSGVFARGAFPAKPIEGLGAHAAVFADLDADGLVDLAIANGIPSAHAEDPPTLQPNEVYLQVAGGGFEPLAGFLEDGTLNAPALSRGVAAGDLDGDGAPELYFANATENVVLQNDGRGRFRNISDELPAAVDSTYDVEIGDIDLDGDLDIVLAYTAFNPLSQVLLVNQGGAQGGEEGVLAPGAFPAIVAGQSAVRLGGHLADVDNDGDLDVLFAIHEFGAGESPDLYLNQGGRQHGTPGEFVLDERFEAPRGVYRSIATGDLDGDGDLDVLLPMTSNFAPEKLTPRTYLLRGSTFAGENTPLAFRRGDANGDGRHDLSDAVRILGHLFLGEPAPGCLASADVNSSGTVDLSDAVHLLAHLFSGGVAPAAPFPGFGDAESAPTLGCARVEILR